MTLQEKFECILLKEALIDSLNERLKTFDDKPMLADKPLITAAHAQLCLENAKEFDAISREKIPVEKEIQELKSYIIKSLNKIDAQSVSVDVQGDVYTLSVEEPDDEESMYDSMLSSGGSYKQKLVYTRF